MACTETMSYGLERISFGLSPYPSHTATTTNHASLSTRALPTSANTRPLIGLYELDRHLGSGSFAEVRMARHQITKSEVAVKIIDKVRLDAAGYRRMEREVDTLKRISHPNLLRLYQVMDLQNAVYLVTELASEGDLFGLLCRHGKFSESHSCGIFRQLVSAVKYLHSHHIVHRDLKAENILLNHHGQVKVADFGFSTTFFPGEKLRHFCGSPPYAAPEMFLGQEYNGPPVDIWSLGVVLYVMVCGALPFDGDSIPEIKEKVLTGRFRVPFFLTTDCEHLIKKMLMVEPSRRCSLAVVQQHSWSELNLGKDRLMKHKEEMERLSNLARTFLTPCQDVLSKQQPPAACLRGVDNGEQSGLDFGGEPLNHRVLQVMQHLGIDLEKTAESVRSRLFDHHSAIYHIFSDKLRDVTANPHQPVRRQPAINPSTVLSSVESQEQTQNATCSPLLKHGHRLVVQQPAVPFSDYNDWGSSSVQPGAPPSRGMASLRPPSSMSATARRSGPLSCSKRDPEEELAAAMPCFTIGRRSSDGAALRGDIMAFRHQLQMTRAHQSRTFTSSIIEESTLSDSIEGMEMA